MMILNGKSKQLREVIKSHIINGVYSLHSRLPSERQLSELFQVSRDMVRIALQELTEQQILKRSRGRGTFVNARPESPENRDTRFVLNIVMWHESLYNQLYRDLFEKLFEHLGGSAEIRMYFTFELDQFELPETPGAVNLLYGMFSDEAIRVFCRHYPNTLVMLRQLSGCNSLYVNQQRGGELSARTLLETGHRNIAAIRLSEGLHGSSDFRDRFYGFKNHLESNDVELAIDFYDPNWLPWHKCSLMIDYFLAKRSDITAIWCPFDQIAVNIYNELLQRKFKIPDDFSVISFDDYYFMQFLTPPLTTVSVSIEVLALRLFDGIEALRHRESFSFQLEPFLVPRHSIRILHDN